MLWGKQLCVTSLLVTIDAIWDTKVVFFCSLPPSPPTLCSPPPGTLTAHHPPHRRIVMVESIPEGLDFNSTTSHLSIFHAWLKLLSEARSSVDIASFYWTLSNNDTGTQEPTAQQVSCSFECEIY